MINLKKKKKSQDCAHTATLKHQGKLISHIILKYQGKPISHIILKHQGKPISHICQLICAVHRPATVHVYLHKNDTEMSEQH